MENCCNYFFRETQTDKVDKTKQNKTKSNDELSVIASKTREALMLFYIYWYWLCFVRVISLNSVILHNISRKVTSLLSVFFNGAHDDIIQIQQTVCPGTEPVLLIK